MSDPKAKKTEGEGAKDPKTYYHSYYVEHRAALSTKRRKRYATDTDYNKEVKRRAMSRYRQIRDAKLKERQKLQQEAEVLNREAGKLQREINDLRVSTPASSRIVKMDEQLRNLVAAIEEKNRALGPGVRGYNRPRVMPVNGQDILVHCVSEFADRVGRDVQTITAWEQNGVIPPPTVTDEMGRRWYDEGHMNLIAGIAEQFRSGGGRNLPEFKELVWKSWKKSKDVIRVS
jgi:DNA-binding transcriptional MerR regulator